MTPWARRIGLLLVLAGLMGATAVMQTTSASWNDSANFTAQVSSGTWGQPPIVEGGISAGNDDTVIEDIVWSVKNPRQFCTEVLVTGRSGDPRHWAIDVDLTQAPFNGAAASDVHVNGTGTITITGAHTVEITGRETGGPWRPRTNNTPITDAQTAELTICVHNAPPPAPADPSTYSVAVSQGTRTPTQACVVLVITSTRHDLDTYPFYYGWTADVDLRAAIQHITTAGNVPSSVTWMPTPDGDATMAAAPTIFSPPQPGYEITSGYNLALRALGGGADSQTVTACVNGTIPKGNGKNTATMTSTSPSAESIDSTERVAVTTPATTSTTIPDPTNLPSTGSGTGPAMTNPGHTEPESSTPGGTAVPTTIARPTAPIEEPPDGDRSGDESS